MEYDFRDIEDRWQKAWKENGTYKVTEDPSREKYYALDMFPYPSGAGLHVGHPLGYIASDVYARYKRHQGYNVLHPMGFDSFGLPAEQYAIQTGQHPAITTEQNINRYLEQLEKIGFSYDWSREVRTSDPAYYKWTQWIFARLYEAWYNNESNRCEHIDTLIAKFEENGSYNVEAACEENWWKGLSKEDFPIFGEHFAGEFTATDWKSLSEKQQQLLLMNYRLTYLADSWVNWCPALGTVLANDEIKDGVSERGGHPVEQKLMRQWSMRISAFSQRLLDGLDTVDWTDSIKEMQRNWIGRSEGASVFFEIKDTTEKVEVFTTRPDTIFGATFMVLAPEHELVGVITTDEHRDAVNSYITNAQLKTERDRQANVKDVTGQFTGAYARHPFTGDDIPVYIAEYVLVGYGTGAVMAVPAGDQRDYDFAKHFGLTIPNIFEGADISECAMDDKAAILANSDFLNGMSAKEGIRTCIEKIEEMGIGRGKINYRLRDAVFSRQRYWGEPFPVYYDGETPKLMEDDEQVTLPPVDKYLPTETGDPPLANARKEDWNIWKGDRMEYNTMPGWAGSSWYFLRYMDPNNQEAFCSPEKSKYWGQVDLYIGGAEHATGHLLYSRFWTKFLYDMGYIHFDEPFAKMINQGMILGRSSLIYRFQVRGSGNGITKDWGSNFHVTNEIKEAMAKEPNEMATVERFREIASAISGDDQTSAFLESIHHHLEKVRAEISAEGMTEEGVWICPRHVAIDLVDNDVLDINATRNWQPDLNDAVFLTNADGKYVCGHEVEKMSKRWHNVANPDDLCEKYGADTLRLYEMFLGPLEQSKPWDTNGISGVHGFLRKTMRLFINGISDDAASKEELRSIHKTIKKVTGELDRYSWNTVVSAMMICVNELTDLKCNKREVLEPLSILLSPYAPHIAEELWSILDKSASVVDASWPTHEESYLTLDEIEYPVSFNGKMRFKISLPAAMAPPEVEAAVLAFEKTPEYLDGKVPKKVIVVPKRIVNIVV